MNAVQRAEVPKNKNARSGGRSGCCAPRRPASAVRAVGKFYFGPKLAGRGGTTLCAVHLVTAEFIFENVCPALLGSLCTSPPPTRPGHVYFGEKNCSLSSGTNYNVRFKNKNSANPPLYCVWSMENVGRAFGEIILTISGRACSQFEGFVNFTRG